MNAMIALFMSSRSYEGISIQSTSSDYERYIYKTDMSADGCYSIFKSRIPIKMLQTDTCKTGNFVYPENYPS